ncbi:site-2 protease family protein [Halobacillus sp. A5]|uniref:site-2 protease family protein n=1 Tax=Halobacillus sp. A5 TaxID=2880263 RepID=UPI0020A6383B|nr:site-2 protease family protein [Halobacillus sp. A5]MCP3025542.1 stage IV sporulation protein FB [Halobacillus sp. A5]
MKALKINHSIHIHPLFFLLALSAFFTGAIYEFIILFSIVAMHELGHYRAARSHGWRVSHIEFWLLGGKVVSEEHTTRPVKEQVHVTLAGPFQHVWIFILLQLLTMIIGPHPLLSAAFTFNSMILLLNLLPVWPLDGGKLLFYLLCQQISFKKSLKLTLLISIIAIIISVSWLIFDERMTLAGTLLAGFLLLENVLEWKRQMYVFMRYILHRLDHDTAELKVKYLKVDPRTTIDAVITNIRANRHYFYVLKREEGLYIVDEQECLSIYLKRNRPKLCLGDISNLSS